MKLKYDIEIHDDAIYKNIDRLTNQVFKLLPCREEGGDWMTPLRNLILDFKGVAALMENHVDLFPLIAKLVILQDLIDEEDFSTFRRIIFECLGLCNSIKNEMIK